MSRRQPLPAVPTSLFISGGIGDVLALSCFLDAPHSVDTVFLATRRSGDVEAFLSLICGVADHYVDLWGNDERFAWYSLDEYVRATSNRQVSSRRQSCLDWSIATQFPIVSNLPFQGMPWQVGHPWSDIHTIGPKLADGYFVFCPFSEDKRDPSRDLTAAEIAAVTSTARRKGVPLVILNRGEDSIVEGAGIVNLQNQTNLFGAIDVTLGAAGYVGVDSAMSVVASKVLPAERLCVKTVNEHCRRWRHLYFAPHTSFEFLTASPVQRMESLQWTV